jgi:hypothetical protein
VKQRLVEYLASALLKRRRNLADWFLITTVSSVFPGRMRKFRDSINESMQGQRVSIVSNSDLGFNLYSQLQSGDYWVKYELIKAFGERGWVVTNVDPAIIIHLFGYPAQLARNAYKIVWIYSHPDLVNAKVLSRYDKIFCLSPSFIKKINEMGFEAELMTGATAKRPIQSEIKYDIVFVGNNRGLPHKRKIVQDVGETPYNFKVWGAKWERVLPKKYYGGEYIDNQKLDELYASSLITLTDHQEDMNREGFVSVRVFDVLASGGFCISDKNHGIQEIFGDSVPQYESPEHLSQLIDFYINHPDERLKLMEKGREIALSHTWQKRAEQFLQGIDESKLRGKR